jgi:hypothetical protein
LLQRNNSEPSMADGFEAERELGRNDWQFGSWRVVVSAWTIVLVFVILLAGVSAVACLRGASHSPHHRHLAGAVIPQHDPCAGPGVASAPGIDGCKSVPLSEDRSAYW